MRQGWVGTSNSYLLQRFHIYFYCHKSSDLYPDKSISHQGLRKAPYNTPPSKVSYTSFLMPHKNLKQCPLFHSKHWALKTIAPG